MAIDTRENVKAALGITSTDNDTRIDTLLDPLTSLFEREANRGFESRQYVEYHFGGEQSLALREYPVTAIDEVLDRATGETLDSDDYEIESRTGLLRRKPAGAIWAEAKRWQLVHLRESTRSGRWKITYTAGEVPGDVKLAFYESIGSLLAGTAGMASEKDGDYSYSRAPGSLSTLPDSAKSVLRRYRAGSFV